MNKQTTKLKEPTAENAAGSALFPLILDLHRARLEPSLKEMSGPWVVDLDEQWLLVMNGQPEPITFERKDIMGWEIPPYHVAFFYNGWAAGCLHPLGGGWLAAGEGANEASLTEALRRAIRQAGEEDSRR